MVDCTVGVAAAEDAGRSTPVAAEGTGVVSNRAIPFGIDVGTANASGSLNDVGFNVGAATSGMNARIGSAVGISVLGSAPAKEGDGCDVGFSVF